MTPNSCKVIYLTKDNYKDYLPLGEIAAFIWADPGAQGECGALHIMTTDLTLYKTNYMRSNERLLQRIKSQQIS